MDQVIIGVDTHKSNHIAVAIDAHGAHLGSTSIPTTRKGYHDLQVWASQFGHVKAFGIEGTGSFGAGLSRDLLAKGHKVLDGMRPLRQLRYLMASPTASTPRARPGISDRSVRQGPPGRSERVSADQSRVRMNSGAGSIT